MTQTELKHRYPFLTVNVIELAKGLLDMFDESERVVLRFGMLPAKKMECFERNLIEHFRKAWPIQPDHDEFELLTVRDGECHFYEDLSLKRIVSDVMHAISLEIYKRGDLVV